MDWDGFGRASDLAADHRPEEALALLPALEESENSATERALLKLLRGNCYSQLGRLDDALDVLATAHSEWEEVDRAVRLRIEYMEAWVRQLAGQFPESASQFEAFLKNYGDLLLEGDDPAFTREAKTRYAYSLVHCRRYGEAIPILSECASESDDLPQLLLFLGTALASVGRVAEGRARLVQAVQMGDELIRERAATKLFQLSGADAARH